MSEIDTVFDSMGDEGMSAYTVDPASEPHIIIGADRRITVPDELKRLAVQFDHNAETVTFDCPRYQDGVDMLDKQVWISMTLPGSIPNAYKATNVVADENDPNIMHFDWTIKEDMTQVQGSIKFLVVVVDISLETGKTEFRCNTDLCNDCYINEGSDSLEEI